MNKIESITAGLFLAGALSGGCANSQVNGLRIVNCDSGPKSSELSLVADLGQEYEMGSVSVADKLSLEQSVVRIKSLGNGEFSFNVRDRQGGNIDVDSNPNTIVKIGPVLLNPDHSITFNSARVDITVKGIAVENGKTRLDIKAKCV